MKIDTLSQADELVELAHQALANEIPIKHIDKNKLNKAILSLLDNPSNLFHTVEIVDDEMVAFFVGSLHEGLFDCRLYATEISAYVKPAHRGFVIADKMRQAFEQWALQNGADVVNIMTFSTLAKPLQARGYTSKQRLFYKEIGG